MLQADGALLDQQGIGAAGLAAVLLAVRTFGRDPSLNRNFGICFIQGLQRITKSRSSTIVEIRMGKRKSEEILRGRDTKS
jgi:hypothetical protein